MSEKDLKELRKNCEYGTKEYWHLSLREMVNSVWCYNEHKELEEYFENKYILGYLENGLTMEELKKIVTEQLSYLKNNCYIEYNVYTDNEGLTYNSIIEKSVENE